MALQSTMYQKQNIDVSAAPWTMHEFFAGSGLVAYGLKGMFAPVWANDISEQKAAVYEANFGCDRFILDDIKNIKGSVLPFANLSWASFPCQDLSLAGSIGGIHASRSGLVWEWLRVLDEMDNYSSFSSQIRQIASLQVESLVQRKDASAQNSTETSDSSAQSSDQKTANEDGVTDEVYTVYVSGIDTRGAMTSSSRSDVNIILTINARTKQILMISTPRDYFVPLSISNGVPDKLTHAGIYGVNVSMDTLDMLYDININYYFRLNFGGFIKIIDALGGITLNSDYDFDSQNETGYHFNKGENHVNGEQALVFSRERYAFKEGDRQRGRNQMAVIQGVVDKVTQPSFLKNYLSVMDSLDGCFETNIPYDLIASLVRKQLDEGGSWQVLSYSVNGTGDTQKPYSMSAKAYVMVPDQTTVDKAKVLMNKVREGFQLSDADVAR